MANITVVFDTEDVRAVADVNRMTSVLLEKFMAKKEKKDTKKKIS